jgi:hypothetical protein
LDLAETRFLRAKQPRPSEHVTANPLVLPKPAERVMLGFYFEDLLAIFGPGAADRLRAVSTFYWKGCGPKQCAVYVKTPPKIAGLSTSGTFEALWACVSSRSWAFAEIGSGESIAVIFGPDGLCSKKGSPHGFLSPEAAPRRHTLHREPSLNKQVPGCFHP